MQENLVNEHPCKDRLIFFKAAIIKTFFLQQAMSWGRANIALGIRKTWAGNPYPAFQNYTNTWSF